MAGATFNEWQGALRSEAGAPEAPGQITCAELHKSAQEKERLGARHERSNDGVQIAGSKR